ncbi:MAG: response regulator [Anaerolineae bacterium]|nr:MAG: response regulator [Anaerolineae bacterium]
MSAKGHILYIEDDSEMITLVRLIMERNGYRFTGTTSGQEGWELIQSEHPDLVLLDLMMPDVDGWQVYQNIRSHPQTRDIPVVIITAKAQDIDKVLGLHVAQVDDYITKPFRPEDLVASVEKLLNRQAD